MPSLFRTLLALVALSLVVAGALTLTFTLPATLFPEAVQAPAPAPDFPPSIVAWVLDPAEPVFTGAGGDAWDRKIRERGWIMIEDGTYHLWYTGYNDDRSPLRLLGHATSPDGLHWTRDPANPLVTDSWVEDMCVVKRDGTYYMFAEGKDDIAHLLTSTDRIHWTEHGPLDIRRTSGEPISPGPRGTPTVWVEGDTWYLFYERSDQGVWLATSKDRKVWTNVSDDPVLAMGPEPYDRYAVAVDQVLKRDGYYYAYYHANAHKPWKDWTTCVARSRDLIHWEKYPGNPIIDHNWSSGILVEGPRGTWFYTMHPEVRRFRPQGGSGRGEESFLPLAPPGR
ncbi:MAG: glycosylase [Isosphaeraceae bacterium]|nr:glycosylase [Isosphaeraceae bacterium]